MPSLRSKCGNSSADRALAFQAGGRGFESRFPLTETTSTKVGVVFLYFPYESKLSTVYTKKQPKLRKQQVVSVMATPRSEGMELYEVKVNPERRKQQVVSVKAPPLRDGRTK